MVRQASNHVSVEYALVQLYRLVRLETAKKIEFIRIGMNELTKSDDFLFKLSMKNKNTLYPM